MVTTTAMLNLMKKNTWRINVCLHFISSSRVRLNRRLLCLFRILCVRFFLLSVLFRFDYIYRITRISDDSIRSICLRKIPRTEIDHHFNKATGQRQKNQQQQQQLNNIHTFWPLSFFDKTCAVLWSVASITYLPLVRASIVGISNKRFSVVLLYMATHRTHTSCINNHAHVRVCFAS